MQRYHFDPYDPVSYFIQLDKDGGWVRFKDVQVILLERDKEIVDLQAKITRLKSIAKC